MVSAGAGANNVLPFAGVDSLEVKYMNANVM